MTKQLEELRDRFKQIANGNENDFSHWAEIIDKAIFKQKDDDVPVCELHAHNGHQDLVLESVTVNGVTLTVQEKFLIDQQHEFVVRKSGQSIKLLVRSIPERADAAENQDG